MERALRILEEQFSGKGPLRMVELHAQCPDEAVRLSQGLTALFDCPDPFLAELSPVIGTHGGPGTLGVGVYAESLIR